MDEIIELNRLPYEQARRLVASGVPVYLPVNPVEYHGPHLPLYTDYILSLASARDLHSRLRKRHPEWPFVIAAPLHMGVDPVPGFGSMAFPYQAVRRAVLESCAGLAELGAQRVLLMTFHGAPMHGIAMQCGVEWLRSRGIAAVAPFNWVVREMLDYRPESFASALTPIADPAMREHIARNLPLDFHGGFFETSVMLHYHPEVVANHQKLPPCPEFPVQPVFGLLSRLAESLGLSRLAAELRFAAYGLGWLKLNPLPGHTGWPHLANPTSGAAFAEAIMERYVPGVEAAFFERGPVPEPIMRWMVPLSLGGRIAPH